MSSNPMTTAPLISGPHAHSEESVAKVMATVMVALLPATLFGFWAYGWPAIFLFTITLLSTLAGEAIGLQLAGKPQRLFLLDGSAILTGWLLALSLPPWAPWWVGVVGGLLATLIGKQIFGGIGQNLFNPAMLARVALLISFPVEMTQWVGPHPITTAAAPGFLDGLAITFSGIPNVDSVTGASILGHAKTELTRGIGLTSSLPGHYDATAFSLGTVAGSMGETSGVLLLLGGIVLLMRKVITWHIPVAMLGSVILLSAIFHHVNPERFADPLFHLMAGGMMLGAFFIATDMVTSPTGRIGQLVFGIGCGVLVWVIRTFGAFPEGVAFAVLLMNAATPLIDHYLRPRIYGRRRDGRPLELAERKES